MWKYDDDMWKLEPSCASFFSLFLVPLYGKFRYPKSHKKAHEKGSAILEGIVNYPLFLLEKVAEPPMGLHGQVQKKRAAKGNLFRGLKISHPFFDSTIWKVQVGVREKKYNFFQCIVHQETFYIYLKYNCELSSM